MCGIIGYIGNKKAVPALIGGLKGLEYRGYDSAGIAYLDEGRIRVHRSVGKLVNLETALRGISPDSRIGIGHTRWATHGKPTEENAHPHQVGGLVLVHNGIIENYVSLKQELQNEGHRFLSETDTEVIVHLIDRELKRSGDFEASVRAALGKIRGSYAICVICEREPEKLIAARNGCPLVVGLGQDEYLVSSDIPPILNHTRQVLVVEDGEMVVIGPKGAAVKDLAGVVRDRQAQTISWTPVMAQKAGYRHFMLKEIFEQPQAILDTFRGRVFPESGEVLLPEIGLSDDEIAGLQKITLVACGTSYHAGLIGKFFIEKLAGIPVEVDIGSEFRYREPILSPGILLVAVSQSGETADTLAALKEARRRGARTLSVCNVVGSTMSRESDGVIYTHAGPEIGVAATKTFTAQLTALYLLGIFLGLKRGVTDRKAARGILTDLLRLPGLVESALAGAEETERLAKLFFKYRDFLYMGRGVNYPIALEGALKLKELSYIHAEGYPAGEMKHGPIALIDENVPIVVLAPEGKVYEKILGNVMEVKARGGVVVAVATEGDREIGDRVEHALYVPPAPALLTPVVLSVPLQLLAYHIAVLRGCDVDQPRNLAKSVTVE